MNSDLATAIRTCIVFVIAGLFALIIDVYKPRAQLKKTNNRANATTQDDNFSTPPNKVNLNTDDQSNILALSKYVPRNKHKIIIEIIFLLLSAITTTFAWLMYYRALSMGEASVVAPIDKLSIAFTILLSWIFLKEKLVKKSLWGILFLTLGSISVIF
ncbi:MAG: EamA family transporter [Christensenellaceae bacterium]|nr:EamA family transporter [Christensenellaceae bacterium]